MEVLFYMEFVFIVYFKGEEVVLFIENLYIRFFMFGLKDLLCSFLSFFSFERE